MAELADALALGASAIGVKVRVLSPAPKRPNAFFALGLFAYIKERQVKLYKYLYFLLDFWYTIIFENVKIILNIYTVISLKKVIL